MKHDCQFDDCCRQEIYNLYTENKKSHEALRQKHMELQNKFTQLMDKFIMVQGKAVQQAQTLSPSPSGKSLANVTPLITNSSRRLPMLVTDESRS